ncbi:MAG TPA: RDD family protein [Limnobacter sp.]|nr:RDD family protein [Limnobacter sp.]
MFDAVEYAGFWVRAVAFFIDLILLTIISNGLLFAVLSMGFPSAIPLGESADLVFLGFYLLTHVILPIALICGCWLLKQATPGKMLFSLKVVHADKLDTVSPCQAVGRYFAYVVSSLPLCLGFVWAAFDPKKRGWHDLLSKTVVIRDERL